MQILSIAKGLFNKIIDGTLKAGDVKSANESIMEMVNINLLPGNILNNTKCGNCELKHKNLVGGIKNP
jgi:hypothetical protein